MKTSYRKLQLLISFGIINPNDFYSIMFHDGSIECQGKYSPKVAIKYVDWGGYVDKNSGFISYNKKNISIVLT